MGIALDPDSDLSPAEQLDKQFDAKARKNHDLITRHHNARRLILENVRSAIGQVDKDSSCYINPRSANDVCTPCPMIR